MASSSPQKALQPSDDIKPSGEIVLNLARIMADRHISLNDLASQIGITNVNLSKIKNNHVTAIRFSTLAALCSALDCQVSDLLEYKPPKS